MNDEILEQHLRSLPEPELPANWRAEILPTALREARASSRAREVWPALLVNLRNLCLRNPVTAGAMTALWALIFLFKASTPVDPAENMMLAHYDPNRPVYLVSIRDQILIAELLQDQPDQRSIRRMP